MDAPGKTLEIRSAPHILSGYSVDTIMFNVVAALVPTIVFAVCAFGLAAVAVLATSLGACLLTEHLACRWSGARTTIGDGSAIITGLLYGLTLPPGLPLWMVATGGAICVGLGKAIFGGLGRNPFNPALVGRAILQAAFPVAMTTWTPAFAAGRFATLSASTLTWPFTQPTYDAITQATPLAAWKFDRQATEAGRLALGFVSGSIGETSAVLILLGGAYLVARNMMNWRIPLSILATVAVVAELLHAADPARYAGAAFMLCSGGLMLGAVFMATDMVGSPMTAPGAVVYGVLIGLLVVVIRVWGGMPEGVMYAILLGNALTPHIDRLIRPRVFGVARRRA